MIIAIGSTNPVKIAAVKDYLVSFSQFSDALYESLQVSSDVNPQPVTMDETFQGSINRAKAAWALIQKDNNSSNTSNFGIGIGIEGGIAKLPLCNTGYMNICAACLFDGKNSFFGLSSGFEHPPQVLAAVFDNGLEVADAYQFCNLALITQGGSEQVKHGQGAIGFMTDGRLNRKDYCIQALIPAVGAFLKQDLFNL